MEKCEEQQSENIKKIRSISEFLSMLESISIFKSKEKKSLNVFFKQVEKAFNFLLHHYSRDFLEKNRYKNKFSKYYKDKDLKQLGQMSYDNKIIEKLIESISKKFENEFLFIGSQPLKEEVLKLLHTLDIQIQNRKNITKKFVLDEFKFNKKQQDVRSLYRLFNIINQVYTDFIKKYKYNSIKKDYEIVFRSPSNIAKGIDVIKKERIFLSKPSEESILNYRIFNNKFRETNLKDTIANRYEFWYEYEKPSLFKKNDFIENENNIYKDFISSNPQEFKNMTTFDILTKMRHYEVPNRLLDVTLDPLLALYFACGKNNYGSKTIFVYIVKKDNIKYYDSDTVTVLSILTKLKKEQKEKLKKIVDIFKKSNGEYYKSEDKVNLLYKKKKIEMPKNKSDKDIDKIISIIKGKDIKEYEQLKIEPSKESKVTVKNWFNYLVSQIVSELNWQLKQEIPGWYEGIFDLETFTQCYLVKPKMNNPRIIAQSGAFFIYPFEDSDIRKILLEEAKPEINRTIYEIDTNSIMEELDRLNIDSTKYFPDDLVKYKEEITDRYRS